MKWKTITCGRHAGRWAAFALTGLTTACAGATTDWPVYGGDPGSRHASPLRQIDRNSIGRLAEVWRRETGVGGLQTSPLVLDGVVYGYGPNQEVLALDGATGAVRWRFTDGAGSRQPARGLAYWRDGRRVGRLLAGVGPFLYALDPATGRPIPGFGDNGRIDLRDGLGRDPATLPVYLTSPAVIWRDLAIVGFRTTEVARAAPGAIRAYDTRTGALRWAFHLAPQPGEAGHDTWTDGAWRRAGGANAWAGLSVDVKRGLVFAPTGSATPDFYGGDPIGDNLFANSLVALDAASGRRVWHQQLVRHDLWDRDLPAPPVLVNVRRGGRTIDAVAQATKQGDLFIFERATGRPLFPIDEVAVPPSDIPGEVTAPTQPRPRAPAPFVRQSLTEAMLTRRTPAAQAAALAAFRGLHNQGPFTPYRLGAQTLVVPGYNGGAEWGGAAFDARRGWLFLNANDIPMTGGLAAVGAAGSTSAGAEIYAAQCAACHGLDLKGAPPDIPALTPSDWLTPDRVGQALERGAGRMPAIPYLTGAPRRALFGFLFDDGEAATAEASPARDETPYVFTGYRRFADPDGYPAVEPPWGVLNAIDLTTGRYAWRVPLGEYPELVAAGLPPTGAENYGGPLLTGSGLLFIGATIWDRKFRAFDARTGAIVWSADLPYAGVATPVTYAIAGRQYVLIATSGARDRAGPQGSAYVAFALPRSTR